MNNRLLEDLVLCVKEQNLNVLNVVVRQGGEIIAKHDFKEEEPQPLWSVSKTFTSMAVGIAINEGYFKLNDYVLDWFPEIPEASMNENLKKLTIHDLLCMGSGHAECPIEKALQSKTEIQDISKMFFEEPFVLEPGTHFTYDNSASYMLSKLISTATKSDLAEFLNQRIFQPLAIPKPKWDTCPKGTTLGFIGLHLKAEELSRFGQLILNKGVWKGTQLIPASYIKKASTVQIKTDNFNTNFATADHHQGYGYQMWMNAYPHSYRMDGLYGQYVVMLPDKDAVVTYVSNEPRNMTGVLNLTWNTIVDKL